MTTQVGMIRCRLFPSVGPANKSHPAGDGLSLSGSCVSDPEPWSPSLFLFPPSDPLTPPNWPSPTVRTERAGRRRKARGGVSSPRVGPQFHGFEAGHRSAAQVMPEWGLLKMSQTKGAQAAPQSVAWRCEYPRSAGPIISSAVPAVILLTMQTVQWSSPGHQV